MYLQYLHTLGLECGPILSPCPIPRALEFQIQEIVTKILDGQGLPWPKPPSLKRLVSHEKTRVLILRLLEIKLGVRRQDEMTMFTNSRIMPVVRNQE